MHAELSVWRPVSKSWTSDNCRVCSQWPKSSQKLDRSVLVSPLCAHSVSQTCDLAYRNHCFRRWSNIRTHSHSQIHMEKQISIQTLWNRASLIQVSLLVATGMVSSLKSQLSCFLSRPTWNISISQWHALLDRNTHCKSLLFLFEKRCPVPLLLMASIEQLLLVWTCFKSRAGCICECSLVESCLLHTKPKEGEWDVPRVNPCKKQREHVRIKISPCKIDVDPSPWFYIISTGIVESTRHGLLPKASGS